jgi:hypothetical protein
MSGTQFLRSHFTGPSADSESTFLSTISLQLRRVRLISLLQLLALRLEDTLGTLCVIVVVDQIEALHALALANARELLAAMNLSQVCHSALVKTAQTGALCGAFTCAGAFLVDASRVVITKDGLRCVCHDLSTGKIRNMFVIAESHVGDLILVIAFEIRFGCCHVLIPFAAFWLQARVH